MSNFIFISPNFPKTYYQFPLAWKQMGHCALGIGDEPWDSLSAPLKEALDEYYQVANMEDYGEMYRAVAWLAHKHGRIDWLESNNEYWLEQDARLRTDFNISSGDKIDTVMRFKTKSNMKAYYAEAGCPVAKWHLVTDLKSGQAFVKEVGFPVVVKPDNGVGAGSTWKLNNEQDLRTFYAAERKTPYIMEEYVPGFIQSFDGLTDQNGEIVFRTSHIFPEPIMNIVLNKGECWYYNVREVPEDLDQLGAKVIRAFRLKGRFFHAEFFRLSQDKSGLGKKGELIGLEVNMRPPGGYTTDMMNFAGDYDIYATYAMMALGQPAVMRKKLPYHCVYVGKRSTLRYAHSMTSIYRTYGKNICMHETMPFILQDDMGDDAYIARFKTLPEMEKFVHFVYDKQKDRKG
ncbi:MAG: ATP-grasp domain-containing protein [Bulleidia sp.]